MNGEKAVHRLLSRLKGGNRPETVSLWGGREITSFCVTVVARMMRGLYWKFRFKKVVGLLLCGQRVVIHHPWHIIAGPGLNLEEGCEIVGFATRGIVLGTRCTVGRHAVIRPTNVLLDTPGEGLRLGDGSNIGAFSYIGCSGFIDIGARVLMGPRVTLIAENHVFERLDVPIKEQGVRRAPIRVEDDCWLGSGCTILAGVTVGHGSVVAAGAVVTRDVPPFSVVGGVPARIIKSRMPPVGQVQ